MPKASVQDMWFTGGRLQEMSDYSKKSSEAEPVAPLSHDFAPGKRAPPSLSVLWDDTHPLHRIL